MDGSALAVPAEVVADTTDQLGESPVWDARCRSLWWIDLRAPALHKLDADTQVTTLRLPDLVGAVVQARTGVLVALPDGWWRLSDSGLDRVFAFPDNGPCMRLNDAKVDARGRLWFGAMRDRGADDAGGLYVLEGGMVRRCRDHIRIPNALAVSPDGRRLAFTDTAKGRIEIADITGDEPVWQSFAVADIAPGQPDGACFDAEGYLWNARYGGACLARIAPDGQLDRLLKLPITQPTSCAFGGPDLSRLYVTTARQGLSLAALAAEPLAGALLSLDPGVCGVRDHEFPD